MDSIFIKNINIRLIYLVVIALLIMNIQSCKYDCNGFSSTDLAWIPYNIEDSLFYTNSFDTIEFKIIDFYKTEPNYHRGFFIMDYDCEYEGYYISDQTYLDYQIQEKLSESSSYNKWSNWGMKIQITDNDIFTFDIWEKTTFSDTIGLKYFNDTIIEGQNLSEVFLISKNIMDSSQKISWIIKVKDKGIFQFYDKNTDKIWTMINK